MLETITSATRPLSQELSAVLRSLKPGERVRITHVVRVGGRHWPAVVEGNFRDLGYLRTGLATHRVPNDDVIVVAVHFTKDNGELSSMVLDEHTRIEILEAGP